MLFFVDGLAIVVVRQLSLDGRKHYARVGVRSKVSFLYFLCFKKAHSGPFMVRNFVICLSNTSLSQDALGISNVSSSRAQEYLLARSKCSQFCRQFVFCWVMWRDSGVVSSAGNLYFVGLCGEILTLEQIDDKIIPLGCLSLPPPHFNLTPIKFGQMFQKSLTYRLLAHLHTWLSICAMH